MDYIPLEEKIEGGKSILLVRFPRSQQTVDVTEPDCTRVKAAEILVYGAFVSERMDTDQRRQVIAKAKSDALKRYANGRANAVYSGANQVPPIQYFNRGKPGELFLEYHEAVSLWQVSDPIKERYWKEVHAVPERIKVSPDPALV